MVGEVEGSGIPETHHPQVGPAVSSQITPESLPPLESNLLTVPEVAAKAVVSEYTVRRWIRDGELASIRFGRLIRVREEDWEDYLEGRTRIPTKAPRGPGRPRKAEDQ